MSTSKPRRPRAVKRRDVPPPAAVDARPVRHTPAAPAPHAPSGEDGVRDNTGSILATSNGGTSRTADTTRGAGYVADQDATNDPPPGLPIEKSPEAFAGPESETIPREPAKRRPPAKR